MTIDAFYADDKKRLCDACGKEDYLLCITYPLANLYKGMPTRRTAVWFCKDCVKGLVGKTIELALVGKTTELANEYGNEDACEERTDCSGEEK